MKKTVYVYPSIMERIKTEWPIVLLSFICLVIAESIGKITLGFFTLTPIFYTLTLGIISGPSVTKILKEKHVKAASKLVVVAVLPFIAKIGINAGANLDIIIASGPALLLQEFGNLGTILLAMPVALLMGLKRESIGATHSINRDTNLVLMQDMYGASSPQARGTLLVFITGTIIGPMFFSLMASFYANTGLFHPYALGMASGVGAGIMMSSAVVTLSEMMPQHADQIAALASASETLSGSTGIYMAIFIGLPLCNWLYKHLEPTLGRVTKAGRAAAAAIEAEEALNNQEK